MKKMRNKRILIGILAVLLVAFGVVTTFHVETQTAKAYHKQICILGACFSIYAQIPPSLLNSTYILTDDSMSPNLHQDDGVFVDSHVPFNSLKVGDIIVFKTYGTDASGNHTTIVHRVAEIVIDKSNGHKVLRTKGDANPDSIPALDYPVFQQNYIGKVVYIIPKLGVVLANIKNSTVATNVS